MRLNILLPKLRNILAITALVFLGLLVFPKKTLAEHGTVRFEVYMIVDGAKIRLPGVPVIMKNEYIEQTNAATNQKAANSSSAYAVTKPDGTGAFTTTGNTLAQICSNVLVYSSPGGNATGSYWFASCEAPG